MVLNYHIIIIVLLAIIFSLLILFKKKYTIENFYDHSKDCKNWASYGECTANWKYMIKKCKKECPTQVNDIKNHTKQCKIWADKGYCTDKKQKKYMKERCKKFC